MTGAALELTLLEACRQHDAEEALAALAAVQARLTIREVQRSLAEAGGSSESDRMLTVKDAAAYLSVSEKYIRARLDRLEVRRYGRAVRIPLGAVKRAAALGM